MREPLDFPPIIANNALYVTLVIRYPDGTPVNLTGVAVKWAFFKHGTTAPLGIKRTSDGGITVLDTAAGRIGFWINAADTKDQAAGEYFHEAVTVDADGRPFTVANNNVGRSAGAFPIRKQLTVPD